MGGHGSGRHAAPAAVKRLKGETRPSRLKDDVHPRALTDLAPPSWLKDRAARKEWSRLAPELDRLGLLTVLDVGALVSFCEVWAALRAVQDVLAEAGDEDRGDYAKAVRHAAALRAELVRLGALFGMSPSDRTRVRSTPRQTAGKLMRFLRPDVPENPKPKGGEE